MVENSHRSNAGEDDSLVEKWLEKRSVMKGRTIETGGNKWLKG